jgi:hypothetical protein
MCMPRQYTLERQDVYTLAIETLSHLPLKAQSDQVQPTDLLEVMVFAAASRLSMNQACQDLEGAPSAVTVLGQLATQLSHLDLLEITMCEILARLLPRGLGTKGRRVAVDLIELPYHGSVDAAHAGEVCRGKAKQGTTHFFTYATAYVVLRGRRYTLSRCRVKATMTMDEVLDILLKRVRALGVKISLLLLDRGFYSVKVIGQLISDKQPFIMPAIKRGKKPQAPGGPSGTYVMAQWKSSGWTT